MTIPFHIEGRDGSLVNVTRDGAISVEAHFSSAEKITLDSDNTAKTIVKPRSGEIMIITGLIVNTGKGIPGDVLVQIYESATENSTVVSKAILSFDMVKNQTIVTSPVLIATTEGTYINAVADDSDVNVTLLCYFEKVR